MNFVLLLPASLSLPFFLSFRRHSNLPTPSFHLHIPGHTHYQPNLLEHNLSALTQTRWLLLLLPVFLIS
jgi:hypothetical protein